MGLRKRGKSYEARVQVRGQQFSKVVGTNKAEAKAVQQELEAAAAEARLSDIAFNKLQKLRGDTKVVTFAQAAEAYLLERQHLKASSMKAWQSILNTHLLPEFGKRAMREITPANIRAFQSRLAAEKVNGERVRSESRVNTIMQPLRTICATALLDGVIEADPCVRVKRLKEPPVKVDPLSKEELELALRHVDAHYRPFFTCLAYTGARPSELQALRWTDLDWHRNEFQINKARVRGNEGKTKTPAGNRVVPMLPQVQSSLRELQERTVVHAQYVFLNKRGKPIDKHMDEVWARALRKAGMRHRPSYQLRHTFASLCLAAGVQPAYIAGLMGHGKDLQTFYEHYARFIQAENETQQAKLTAAFQKAPQNSGASVIRLDKNWTNYQNAGLLEAETGTGLDSSIVMGQTRGIEPPNTGTTIQCLNLLATPATA